MPVDLPKTAREKSNCSNTKLSTAAKSTTKQERLLVRSSTLPWLVADFKPL